VKRIATALLCTAALCGTATAAPAPPTGSGAPPSVAEFDFRYERSGGFLPTYDSLRIKPERRATAKRSRSPLDPDGTKGVLTSRFRIGAKAVKRLRALLERADFTALESAPGHGTCADCRTYSIEYRGHEVTFSEAAIPDGLASVISHAEGIIVRQLPFH